MKIYVSVVFLLICLHAAVSTAQECFIDTGNICLQQCGIFAFDCDDTGQPEPYGAYTATALYPDCTKECFGHAIGIDYCNGPHCTDAPTQSGSVQMLQRVLPGAPVFKVSCSGRLVQLDLNGEPEPQERAAPPLMKKIPSIWR